MCIKINNTNVTMSLWMREKITASKKHCNITIQQNVPDSWCEYHKQHKPVDHSKFLCHCLGASGGFVVVVFGVDFFFCVDVRVNIAFVCARETELTDRLDALTNRKLYTYASVT